MLLDRKCNRDSKNVLKTVISHSKWVLQAILFVVQNSVFKKVFLQYSIQKSVSNIYDSCFDSGHVTKSCVLINSL